MEQSTKHLKFKQKRIGNYIVGETIGEGTFGKVKLGRQITTGQEVAIKILQKEKIVDVADVERVSREIHILKLVHHPSIIQLYEIIQTPKHLFLVMEYLENGQLFEHIVKNNRLQQKEACRYFRRIISAIAYLHELNVAHRDLKPQNLLLDWKGGLKVVDFGLSNTYKQGQMLKTACGSPCYAAPEMISSKQYNGKEVDLWSSAVVAFAMVCGYLPFEDNNTNILYKKILSSTYTLPKNVSTQFEDLLKNMLNIDPRKRFNIEQIHTHQWCQLAQDVPLHSGIIVGYHRIPVDKHILSLMQDLGFDIQYTERCIQTNKHNHSTATYYLLLKKQLKNGYKSNADICSLEFDYQSIQPFKRVENIRVIQSFFGGVRAQSSIQLQQPDIKITTNQKSPPKKNLSLIFQSKKARQLSQNKAIQQQKKERQTHVLHRPTKTNDLRMYLNPTTAKKALYSKILQKQSRRKQVQSLHYERNDFEKSQQKPLRLATEYKVHIPAPSIKSKMIKYRHRPTTNSIYQKQAQKHHQQYK